MTSFYTEEEIIKIGFKSVGNNVKISRKASLYSSEKMQIGDNVRIDDFCLLSGKIVLGNNIHIAAYSAIYGGEDGVFIEDYSNISSRVTIYSISDDYSGNTMTNPTIPDEYKHIHSSPVVIKRHCIIGSTSVILPGTVLEEGSAFGAFSFIRENSEPWSVNVGIPSHKIANRSRQLLELEKKYNLN